MNLQAHYYKKAKQNNFKIEPQQLAILHYLELLDKQYLNSKKTKWYAVFTKPSKTLNGLYLWGKSGRGKSMLVDLYFEHSLIPKKHKLHFNHWMQWMHDELHGNAAKKGKSVESLVKFISKQWDLLIIDEFYVEDIGDAILLGRLLTLLLKEPIILIFTSNVAIEDLYTNGLNRDRFLPAIFAMQSTLDVIQLLLDQDFRMHLEKELKYFIHKPLELHLKQAFDCLDLYLQKTHTQKIITKKVFLSNRELSYAKRSLKGIVVSFESLCQTSKSKIDYIELAATFDYICLYGLNNMDQQNEAVKRFILLIDELYLKKTKITLISTVSIFDLYTSTEHDFIFKRCLSRLQEMLL